MSPPARRLSHAEAIQLEETQGRFCPACRTVYPPDQVLASFGRDKRTLTGSTSLCLACIALRDSTTSARAASAHASFQARYRREMKDVRIASARAALEAMLPKHGIPPFALPDYPLPFSPANPPRGPRVDAIYSRLYSLLRDAPAETWEFVSGTSKQTMAIHLEKVGPRMFEIIDEHLLAFDLPPLAP